MDDMEKKKYMRKWPRKIEISASDCPYRVDTYGCNNPGNPMGCEYESCPLKEE